MSAIQAVPVAELNPLAGSPREQVLQALARIPALQGLQPEEYAWLADHGVEQRVPSGATLFHEGQTATSMAIVLAGEIHVRREHGGPSALFTGRSLQLTGLLPYSRMKTWGGLGYAASDLWFLQYDKSLFPAMLAAIPAMTQISVSILLDRVREITRIEQQNEKLTALGKLAGNLAHELNNPASAAQRAASGLLDELRVYGRRKYEMGALCLTREQLDLAQEWQQRIRERSHDARPLDALHTADREDALLRWLNARGVENTWQISPDLAELGVRPEDLDELGPALPASTLGTMLAQFASSARAERMTEAMLDATARIFDLIGAIKDYSYMDQAPIQDVDIPQGIDTTLAMLQSRLEHVGVERRYAPNLPKIAAHASELNQVWMALLENALDAINDRGKLTIAAQLSGPTLLIEFHDNGPGIPPELRDRIFEPFFTTKAPGRGLGLGLDVVQRIIRKHRGFVRVHSEPGNTCFQVRIPLDQLQAY